MRVHRVFVPMSDEERAALVRAAQQSMRDPQQHARFILRSVLLGDSVPTNSKSATSEVSQAQQVNAFASVNP